MIFILGGRGLVGSAFVRQCQAAGEPYTILDRQNYKDYAGSSCDVFVNANGNSSKPLAKTDPLKDFSASVASVRASLVDFRAERYVHLSSCDVYPDCSLPEYTREEQNLEPASQSPYGFHKFLAEQCIRHAAKEWLIFRLGGLVGPGLKKNAIFDILHGGPLWLDPGSALQFLRTDSAAAIALDLARKGVSRQIFNLCGNGLIALREVMDMAGYQVPVNPGSPLVRYDVSIEKLSRVTQVPETRLSVAQFVQSELQRAKASADAGQ